MHVINLFDAATTVKFISQVWRQDVKYKKMANCRPPLLTTVHTKNISCMTPSNFCIIVFVIQTMKISSIYLFGLNGYNPVTIRMTRRSLST